MRSEFSENELKDPDFIDNLKSLDVLKVKVSAFESEYNKVEGRPPKELRERLMKTRVTKMVFFNFKMPRLSRNL